MSTFVFSPLLLRSIAAALATTLVASASEAQGYSRYEKALELASFDTAWTRVRDNYYDATMRGLDWTALRDSLRPLVERGQSRADTRAAISTLLSKLGESHFGVLPGEAMEAGAAAVPGLPGDAGLVVRFVDSALVVTRVEDGAPAARLGIKPGWIIDEIDTLQVLSALRATSTVAESARRFALVRLTLNLNGRLTGPAGDSIRISARDARNIPHRLDVPLRATPGEVVEYGVLPPMHVQFESARLPNSAGCVGVIRFNIFMTPVMPQFQDAMAQMASCRGVILDLRGNLGGVGAMIMGMTGHFFAEPETLGTMRLRGATMRYVANPIKVTRTGAPLAPFKGQVAVLVDELSASTTEILATAMQRLGRARIFGGPSAGQALPAVVTKLPNGDRLMYVIGDFAGPDGNRVEGNGVTPDEETPLSRSALLAGRDQAFDAAVRWIQASHSSNDSR
jgi:carboxyl-terminal processing protease